jgi:hypothetical protein
MEGILLVFAKIFHNDDFFQKGLFHFSVPDKHLGSLYRNQFILRSRLNYQFFLLYSPQADFK